MESYKDYINYPESSLSGRIKLAFGWIPKNIDNLLDGGCAYGYGIRFFKKKCNNAYGIDPNEEFIFIAKERYPHINFINCGLENVPFKSDFFDVIILNDVLEHVKDQLQSLNEMFRILKSKGTIIITTPHKGLFSFMDPENYVFLFKKNFSNFYKTLYRIKKGKYPQSKPGYENKHHHYSLKDMVNMLDNSKFKDNYKIIKIFRSGLFIEVFTINLEFILKLLIGKRLTTILLKPLEILVKIDYWIPYGLFSYNIAIKIIKK